MKARKLKLTKDFTEAERKNSKLVVLIPTIAYMKSYLEGSCFDYISKTIRIIWLSFDFRIRLKFKCVDKLED